MLRRLLTINLVFRGDDKRKNMANFEDIDKARILLGLNNRTTLKEIKQAYGRKAFYYHPDRRIKGVDGEEMMKQLNWSYKLLLDYCGSYSYSFTEGDVARTYTHEDYMRKFSQGWFDGI